MFCSKCGKEIADESAFCIYCGQATGQRNVQTQSSTGLGSIFSRSNFETLTKEQAIKVLAERSLIYALCSIPLITVAIGGVTMVLGLYYGIKSCCMAKNAGLRCETKAIIGIIVATIPLIALIYVILMLCGVVK